MSERMFGLETEYALSAIGPRGRRVDHGRTVRTFMELACRRLPHLPGRSSSGVFLQNGSRFYVDSGAHPELSTPELVNPWDACRYVLAGDRMLAQIAEELCRADAGIEEVVLTRCNVCYAPTLITTWGCHECYGHRADPRQMPAELIPHLVSRQVYTGSGGFNNQSAGIEFMISPRVAHLVRAVSDASTHSRGIYHSKNETLCRGFNRLHVLCGESVNSQTSLWLKTAITAMVVAMIEAGLSPCRRVRLRDPLGTMQRFARDVQLTETAGWWAGMASAQRGGGVSHPRIPPTAAHHAGNLRGWTAIQMQRQILKELECHADHPVMPPWAPEARRRLGQILDRLEQGPGAVVKTLDWAIKLSLYQEVARRRGVPWESLADWNHVLGRLDNVLRRTQRTEHRLPITPKVVRAPTEGWSGGPVADEVKGLTPFLKRQGLSWDQLEKILALRQELFELDTRFSQLGDRGIFAALDGSGALDHHVPGVDNIEHAVDNPPAVGRARLRGECVRRFHGRRGEYSCDWTGVWDHQGSRHLDLSDPFAAAETWQQTARTSRPGGHSFSVLLRDLLTHASHLYDMGQYEAARRALDGARMDRQMLPTDDRIRWCRLRSWTQSRRGMLDATATLDELLGEYPDALWVINDYVSVYRFRGLAPDPQTAVWVDKGVELLQRHPDQSPDRMVAFREHQGYFLLTEGRLEEARTILEEVCGQGRRQWEGNRTMCRGAAVLGEVYRRLGDRPRAQQWLEAAAAGQQANDFQGDLADFSRTGLAKLQEIPARARSHLADAKRIQTATGNRMGEARTLLLEARLAAGAAAGRRRRDRLLQLKEQVPALSGCRLLGKILQRWDEWTGGERSPDQTGDAFWGV